MIDKIVAQGATVVGHLVDVHSTVRLTLEIELDHGPVCLRNVQCHVVSGVETVLIGRDVFKTLGLHPLTFLESCRATQIFCFGGDIPPRQVD